MAATPCACERGSLAVMSRAGSASTDRAESVRRMFSDIAPTYDLLNSLLSLGVDASWRRQAAAAALGSRAEASSVGSGRYEILDVATGTGKLAFAIKRVCQGCTVVGVDFAEPMLAVAREAATRASLDVDFALADGSALPYASASFDAVTIAYGLRNFADPDAGLREFRRVLRPGGRLVVLEFPPPRPGVIGKLFRFYFTRVLPRLGGAVSGQRGAYAYLPQSVLNFFTPEGLVERMQRAGFEGVTYKLQTFGISALHVGHAPRATA